MLSPRVFKIFSQIITLQTCLAQRGGRQTSVHPGERQRRDPSERRVLVEIISRHWRVHLEIGYVLRLVHSPPRARECRRLRVLLQQRGRGVVDVLDSLGLGVAAAHGF